MRLTLKRLLIGIFFNVVYICARGHPHLLLFKLHYLELLQSDLLRQFGVQEILRGEGHEAGLKQRSIVLGDGKGDRGFVLNRGYCDICCYLFFGLFH